MVESYDSLIHRAVPRYDEMTARLLDYLPSEADDILELGCGTGGLSLLLGRRFPAATLTCVDASPEMISVAGARVGGVDNHRLKDAIFTVARFEELALPDDSFDIVVSSISLHHVVDKSTHYRSISALLHTGGRFCFADQIRGEPEPNHQVNWNNWLEFCREAGNCTPAEIESLLDHAAAHDHYVPLSEHFAMLSAAGFIDIDCVWRNWMWGIVTATAP